MTNSASGAEAPASMSTTRNSSGGRRSSSSDSNRPRAMALIIGLRSRRRAVSRASARPLAADCWPISASTRASGIISRFSTSMPRAMASAAVGPSTMATMG
ncbi:hypothetical protein D3C78_1422560 [compost metagenome]